MITTSSNSAVDIKRSNKLSSFVSFGILVLWFALSVVGYQTVRTSAWNDLFGGDNINVSLRYLTSLGINRHNVPKYDEMLQSIQNGRNENPAINRHAFVYSQLSTRAKKDLQRYIDIPEPRNELILSISLNKSLLERKIDWPKSFDSPPILPGYSFTSAGFQEDNLRALGSLYPIYFPAPPLSKEIQDKGAWDGLTSLKLKGFFNLSQPTRYAPLTSIYVTMVQSYYMSSADSFAGTAMAGAILYATFATVVLLFARALLGSWPWAFLAAIMIQTSTSVIAASYPLFSLPYLLVPTSMATAFLFYQWHKNTDSVFGLVGFVVFALIAPWFREFGAAVPFIAFTAELMFPRNNRSRAMLIACIPLMGHAIFPSFLPWLIGLNDGIVVSITSQTNTLHILSPSLNFRPLGLLFIQFPPTYWLVAFLGIGIWLYRYWTRSEEHILVLPVFDKIIDFKDVLGRRYFKHNQIVRWLPVFLFAGGILLFAWFVFIHAADQSEWRGLKVRPNFLAAFSILVFLFFILSATLRLSRLIPVIIGALVLPFMFMGLEEVHMSFVAAPVGILLTLWVRECLGFLPEMTTDSKQQKFRSIGFALLTMVIFDQILNIWGAYKTLHGINATHEKIAQWIIDNTARHSIVIANFYAYPDIFAYSDHYFDPYESIESNPLPRDIKTVHTDEQMNAFLDLNTGIRDIYFLASDHKFFHGWRAGYHRHKWANNPPGKIEKKATFEQEAIYPYLDPLKFFIPRNFINFPGYMDWDIDFYYNNQSFPFLRETSSTYEIFQLVESKKISIHQSDGNSGSNLNSGNELAYSPVPILKKEGVGPDKNINIIHYHDLLYAVPQSLGAVDWESGKVANLPGVKTFKSMEKLMQGL